MEYTTTIKCYARNCKEKHTVHSREDEADMIKNSGWALIKTDGDYHKHICPKHVAAALLPIKTPLPGEKLYK